MLPVARLQGQPSPVDDTLQLRTNISSHQISSGRSPGPSRDV